MQPDHRKPLRTSQHRIPGRARTAAETAIDAPQVPDTADAPDAQQDSGDSLSDSRADRHSPIQGETSVTLRINGQSHTVNIEPRVTLLDVLRERLALTGTKKGCDHGQCGACTVLVDGDRIYSCLTLAIMQEDRAIITIEGLARGEQLHPVQAAFIENDGLQCGYCTPGQICASVALLEEVHRGCASAVTADLTYPPQLTTLSEAEIKERMSGNLCRCSAYNGIVAAVQQVAGQTPPSPGTTMLVQEVTG